MKTKLLAALSLLLLLSTAAGCGGTSAPADETAPSGQTKSTEAPETEEPSALDLLPTDLDFGGYAYHIVYAAPLDLTYETYISMEEENGDILWDNSYYRNRAVEERYNVDLQFVPLGAEQGGYSIVPDVSKSVLAGDDAYQYIQFNSAWDNTVSLIAENALLDLNTLPGLDPYGAGFYAEVNQSFTISDRLYFAFSNYNSSGALPLYMALNQFGIPQTVAEPEIAAAVAQGLAVTSQVMYSPVFLDVYLESKLLRDEESVKVIDMMRSDPLVDVSRYFDFADGAITPVNLLSKIRDSGSVVSQCEKTESAAVKKAEKFFDVFFE